jgi:EmrB/QacA subfamily drug resistance transporter
MIDTIDTIDATAPDPRRWVTLSIVTLAVFIVGLDNSVLNVAIPTILRDFHTTLPDVQWVITGFSLTLATFLVIGGRLGDVYGHRNIFILGSVLFAGGSLLAAVSWSVPSLVVGEAVIEGIGAALMLPSAVAIISITFRGRERGTAFAVWGASVGASGAFGPVVGGVLTTNFSWRWAFGLNVVVGPAAAIGALWFVTRDVRARVRPRLDLLGAALIATGTFLLVFGISKGGTYGWWEPRQALELWGTTVWPADSIASFIPMVFAVAAGFYIAFFFVERARGRRRRDPLFDFSELRFRTFRFGLVTTAILAMGQLALLFVIVVFLQNGLHMSAQTTGLWLVPLGVFVVIGSQLGAPFTRRFGPTVVVRAGLLFQVGGLLCLALVARPSLTFADLLLGFALIGVGVGAASAQLTNVILHEISSESAGVASGAASTLRQVGGALGVATAGTILTTQTINHTVSNLASAHLPARLSAHAAGIVHRYGVNFAVPKGSAPGQAATLHDVFTSGLAAGTRDAILFSAVMLAIGTLLSLLIPRINAAGAVITGAGEVEGATVPLGGLPAGAVSPR